MAPSRLTPPLQPSPMPEWFGNTATPIRSRSRWVELHTDTSLSSEMALRAGHTMALPRLRSFIYTGVAGTALNVGSPLLTDSDRPGLIPLGMIIMMLVTIFQTAAR